MTDSGWIDLATMERFIHVTREDGRVTKVASELRISGPAKLYVNGELVGDGPMTIATEIPLEIPDIRRR